MNPLANVHYPTNTEADLDRLQGLCERLAGFDERVSLEWLDGAMTALAAGPRPRPLVEWRDRLLGDACDSFREHCVEGTEANLDQIKKHLENSLMLVTALNSTIGYDNAAKIAKAAWKNNTTLKEEALKSGLLTEQKFNEVVRPEKMIGPDEK